MMSREADLYERWHSAEYDRRMVGELLFRASWERMVLLASTMEYREAYECALPSPDRDHDLITLEAMLACVMQHSPISEETS